MENALAPLCSILLKEEPFSLKMLDKRLGG